MVKEGSFFQRLMGRLGSGVRVESAGTGRDGNGQNRPKGSPQPAHQPAHQSAPKPPVQRVDPERAAPPPVRAVATEATPIDTKSARKLSEREEALMALGGHFQELTTLLRGSQTRVDDQLTKIVDATSALTALPLLGQQQLETLRALSTQMERQNALGEQMAATMTRLPSLLDNVESALQRAAATDERTAATVREFQSTMDRIHASMSQMVQHSDTQAQASKQLAERRDQDLLKITEGIETSQQRAVEQLRRTTDEGLQSLRRTHEDQSNRLQRVVQEHAGWNRAVLVGIGVVVLGIGALIVLQLLK
ncbi:MAG: hypothetical protein K8J09_18585 [Planctomycetes bacterium]|nr:hypothetical protein [Planctomycetota bacterium]MCC7397007.1 hypothetical protein [Planctomycetota bacterium]